MVVSEMLSRDEAKTKKRRVEEHCMKAHPCMKYEGTPLCGRGSQQNAVINQTSDPLVTIE